MASGWKLIGFEDRHAFQPPFGYYDRDYPGFVDDRGEEAMNVRRYQDSETVDFVIVGSGAAGGVIARRAGAGRTLASWCSSRDPGSRRGLRPRRAEVLVSRRHHQRRRQESADVPQRSGREGGAPEGQAGPLVRTRRSVAPACTTRPTSGASTRSISSSAACSARSPAPASRTGRSPTPISSRTTPRSSGRSASRASPAPARSIRRAPGRTRCRRCR